MPCKGSCLLHRGENQFHKCQTFNFKRRDISPRMMPLHRATTLQYRMRHSQRSRVGLLKEDTSSMEHWQHFLKGLDLRKEEIGDWWLLDSSFCSSKSCFGIHTPTCMTRVCTTVLYRVLTPLYSRLSAIEHAKKRARRPRVKQARNHTRPKQMFWTK